MTSYPVTLNSAWHDLRLRVLILQYVSTFRCLSHFSSHALNLPATFLSSGFWFFQEISLSVVLVSIAGSRGVSHQDAMFAVGFQRHLVCLQTPVRFGGRLVVT